MDWIGGSSGWPYQPKELGSPSCHVSSRGSCRSIQCWDVQVIQLMSYRFPPQTMMKKEDPSGSEVGTSLVQTQQTRHYPQVKPSFTTF